MNKFYWIEYNKKKKRLEIQESGKRKSNLALNAYSKSLDDYYFFSKLSIYCGHLSQSNIINGKHIPYDKSDLILIEEIREEVNKGERYHPIVKIFANIIFLYEGIDNNIDKLFKDTLELAKSSLDIYKETIEIYSLLSNICIYKINRQKKIYTFYSLEINLKIIDTLIGLGQKIQASLYENAVIAALKAKDNNIFERLSSLAAPATNSEGTTNGNNKVQWISNFIAYYKEHVNEEGREESYRYCRALLYFYQKDFEGAYSILNIKSDKQRRGMFNVMNKKVLLLKSIYEIYSKQIYYKPNVIYITEREIMKTMDSLRKLVGNEKSRELQAYQLKFYSDFDKFFRKLYYFYKKYNGIYKPGTPFKKDKEDLLSEVNALNFEYKTWFIEKINEVK